MNALKISLIAITLFVRTQIYSHEFLEFARKNLSDFTRNRKMSFPELFVFMLNLVRGSTQICLNRFFKNIKGTETRMAQQSFSEARNKIKWEACRYLYDKTTDEIYTYGTDTWHGYRLSGIDGSKVQLPSDNTLRLLYGTAGRGDSAVTALGSTLYDLLNHVILDARLEPMWSDERTLAVGHIDHLRQMDSFGRELIIFDRGYPSFELFKYMIEGDKPISFLMRLRRKFNVSIDKLPIGDHQFVLKQGKESISLRIVKFKLKTGEIETLATDLLDMDLSLEDFRQLYFMRWQIETRYGDLKLKFELENFSGRTQNAILQDFFISALIANIVAVALNEVDPIIDAAREHADNKYDYKVNINQAVGSFKDEYIKVLLCKSALKRAYGLSRIMKDISKSLTPIKPGRSVTRNKSPRKSRFHFNQKSNC